LYRDLNLQFKVFDYPNNVLGLFLRNAGNQFDLLPQGSLKRLLGRFELKALNRNFSRGDSRPEHILHITKLHVVVGNQLYFFFSLQKFDGTLTGVVEWGFYVEEKNTKAEGLVRLSSLKDDYYELDKKNYRLVGNKTKKKHSLGDTVRIRLISANLEERTLDWELV